MSASAPPSRPGERGAALIVVLLLVSVMSIAAVGVSEAISHAARRNANAAARDQATWYLLGAEELARQTIRRSFELDADATTLDQPWAVGPLRFEIEAGLIEGELADASNCFNINALAREGPRDVGYLVDEDAVASLRHLLDALDIDAGEAARLANGAADWIDADERARAQGAEDYDYAFADPPYLAANGLFAEVDELRAVAGVSEATFRMVRPYLCARSEISPATLNINTLRVDQAPLLSALFEGRLSVDEARDVIERRPAGGWSDAEPFWELERIRRPAVDESVRERIGVKATHFELHARVRHLDAFVEAHTLFRAGGGGETTMLRRRMGSDA